MLQLRVYGPAASLEALVRGLDDGAAVRSIVITEGVRGGQAVLTAEVRPDAAIAYSRPSPNAELRATTWRSFASTTSGRSTTAMRQRA